MKLNGCGSSVPDGWVNVDCPIELGWRSSFSPWPMNIWNLRGEVGPTIYLTTCEERSLKDRSADIIYSSHLEHLSRRDDRRLAECNRVLRVGGIVRLVVPDLRYWSISIGGSHHG